MGHRMLRFSLSSLAAVAALAFAGGAFAGDDQHQRTGFDNGNSAGWLYQRSAHGIMWVDKHHGHDAPAIHHTQSFTQGSMMFQSRPAWLAPLKQGLPVRIQLDTKARLVNYLGSPT